MRFLPRCKPWRLVPLMVLASVASAQSFRVEGYVAGRAMNVTGPPSWLEGGAGRYEASGDRDDVMGVAQIGVDWQAATWLRLHASGTARRDPEELGGTSTGLVEGYAELRRSFGLDDLQVRAGMFFLPSSRENIDPLWASPYTINFSALNTWIGQEVRPVGVDLQYRHITPRGHAITGGATAFRGNDTMGTLLSWRGWSIGNKLATYDEVFPLPPIPSLSDSGPFFRQRNDGTKPIGGDLDGRTGFAARLRYSIPQRGSVQYTYLDNQGDRRLYPAATGPSGSIYSPTAEYSWDTKYHQISAEIGDPDNLVLAAEYMTGRTEMGVFDPFVEADFDALYVLLSDKRGRNRWTARYEVFGTDDVDRTAAERNDEKLRSWTLSWLFDLRTNVRLGAELTQVIGQRADIDDPDARMTTIELRYRF